MSTKLAKPAQAIREAYVMEELRIRPGSPYAAVLRKKISALALSKTVDEIISEVKYSLPWIQRTSLLLQLEMRGDKKQLRAEREKAKERERRAVLLAAIAKWPRANRFVARGIVNCHIFQFTNHGPLAVTMRETERRFADLTRFAIAAQHRRDEIIREEAAREANRARREAERPERLKELDIQVEREEQIELRHTYVRENVPVERMKEFLLWSHRQRFTLDDDIKDIVAAFLGPVEAEIAQETPQAAQPVAVTESPNVVAFAAPEHAPAPPKRHGGETTVTTRPDQAAFAASVESNCFNTCVVTGSRIHRRCEAAHLVEHSAGGADHYTNGLWLRADIHDLFDDGYCAINPETLELFFTDEALDLDPDLLAWHGKALRPTKRPINPDYLRDRWADFCLTGSRCA